MALGCRKEEKQTEKFGSGCLALQGRARSALRPQSLPLVVYFSSGAEHVVHLEGQHLGSGCRSHRQLPGTFICCCCLVTKSCLTLCDPIYCSLPGFPVLYHHPEFVQTHVHGVGDAIQRSHSLLPPSPPAFNLSQHQGLFQ